MSDVNVPLLRKAVEWVESQATLSELDSQWRQSYWCTPSTSRAHAKAHEVFCALPLEQQLNTSVDEIAEQLLPTCGTAYCVAGYIGQLLDDRYADTDTVDGVHVSEFAAQALGITDRIPPSSELIGLGSGASYIDLFHANNDASKVRRIAEEIAGEKL